MLHPLTFLLAVTLLAGVATIPSTARAESSKSSSASSSSASQAGANEFEENRRAHMQKSKENNTNKGQN